MFYPPPAGNEGAATYIDVTTEGTSVGRFIGDELLVTFEVEL